MQFKQNFLPHHYNEARSNFFFSNSAKGFAFRYIEIIQKNSSNSINNLRQSIENLINLYYKNNNLTNNGLIPALLIGKKTPLRVQSSKVFAFQEHHTYSPSPVCIWQYSADGSSLLSKFYSPPYFQKHSSNEIHKSSQHFSAS